MFDLETLIRATGYLGVTSIVFAESGLFFGFFLPGDSLLFTAGFLASKEILNINILVPLVVAAAIMGDSVGYWFGKKVGPHIFSRPNSWFFSQERVKEAHVFFEKHGSKSLILARFIPAVRTFTPIMAGVAGMRYPLFLTYNIVGGVLWGAGLTLLGYTLGNTVPDADRYIVAIVLVIIIVSLLPIARPMFNIMMSYLKKNREK